MMPEIKHVTKRTKTQLRHFVFSVIVLTILSCQLALPLDVNASEPKIGIEINKEDGRIKNDLSVIPSDSQRIYFEFFLDVPENVDVSLEFRWYSDAELIFSSTGRFGRGYTVAFIENTDNVSPGFSRGNYIVEVWFANNLLISKSFQVD
jgi:hypothetical protein